jgi:hypothetical protein
MKKLLSVSESGKWTVDSCGIRFSDDEKQKAAESDETQPG